MLDIIIISGNIITHIIISVYKYISKIFGTMSNARRDNKHYDCNK